MGYDPRPQFICKRATQEQRDYFKFCKGFAVCTPDQIEAINRMLFILRGAERASPGSLLQGAVITSRKWDAQEGESMAFFDNPDQEQTLEQMDTYTDGRGEKRLKKKRSDFIFHETYRFKET